MLGSVASDQNALYDLDATLHGSKISAVCGCCVKVGPIPRLLALAYPQAQVETLPPSNFSTSSLPLRPMKTRGSDHLTPCAPIVQAHALPRLPSGALPVKSQHAGRLVSPRTAPVAVLSELRWPLMRRRVVTHRASVASHLRAAVTRGPILSSPMIC